MRAAEKGSKTRKPFAENGENNQEGDGALGSPGAVADDSLSFNSAEDSDAGGMSPLTQQRVEEQQEDVEDEGEGPQEGIPSAFFRHPMSDPQTFFAQPVSVKTAMKALQLAVKQPLTNYDEVRDCHSCLHVINLV